MVYALKALLKFGVCASLLVIAACAPARWAKPIGDLKQSVDASVTVIGAYYDDLNSYERRIYFESVYLNPKEEILLTDRDGKPTPLAGRVFSAESIRARLDALRLVSAYARRLADLAGSDAPTKFASNADLLGASLTTLSQTFAGLQGDTSANAYIAPVASLVGLIGQLVLEHRRDAAIMLAITDGDKPITTILDQLERDLGLVVDPLRRTGEKLLLAELVNDYNTTRASSSPDERRRRVDLAAVSTRLKKQAETLAKAAQTLADLSKLVSSLDKLLTIAVSFL